jgi:hypothetical protein
MSISDAFLSQKADDLFSSVAATDDAQELEALDVRDEQQVSRRAIETTIWNALHHLRSPGSRIMLIKGAAGSGKSHVMATTFRRLSSMPAREVYPAILQLTAPVGMRDYEAWLIDTLIRQLTARHFADEHNQYPLRRLAARLLGRMELDRQDEFLRLIEDLDDDGEIDLALKFARRIRRTAEAILAEAPPSEAFLAVVLLAGYGDSAAINYLRRGAIDRRVETLGLEKIETPHQRLMVLKDLALAAQIAGACLVIGFDQVESTVRLGSEDLFVHTLTQAVRIVEAVVNCAVVVATVGEDYAAIVGGHRQARGLMASDRDRIEDHAPSPINLNLGTGEFLEKVITQRLAILRSRAKLPAAPGSFDPLPAWFVPRIRQARSVRMALRAVGKLREMALEHGRMPSQQEYEGGDGLGGPEEVTDFDKLWADFMDVAPATTSKLLDTTKAELVVWWTQEASREYVAGEPAEVTATSLAGAIPTPVIDIVIKHRGVAIERRQLALCEAPHSKNQLVEQLERFLASCTGVPAILRTNGFPKGRQSLVAGSLRKVEALAGLKLGLNPTEWSNLQRAKDFFDLQSAAAGFLAWRRDRQWLLQLISPLQPLVASPETIDPTAPRDPQGQTKGAKDATAKPRSTGGRTKTARGHKAGKAENLTGAFPVFMGKARDDSDVFWAPYRESPGHLNNFSFLITGDAGSGKTQTIRVLIDAACRQDLALTIFDFKGDYHQTDFAAPLGIEVIDVHRKGLPFNPLQPPPRGASGVQPAEHAYELAGVLARVFKLGPVQEGFLRNAITSAYKDAGIEPRDWIDVGSVAWPPFEAALDRLRGQKGAAALVTKLSPLCELGLFPAVADPGQSFESFTSKRVCLDLKELPTDEIKSALAEIIIIQLHGYLLRGDQPRRLKRMIVFDEAHRVKDSRRLESLAREGRAFGVGIVIGTQFPGDIPDTMAGNLATQFFLMNNMAEHRNFVARQMYGSTTGAEAKVLLTELGNLQPFEGLFTNAHHKGVLLKVLPHHARL